MKFSRYRQQSCFEKKTRLIQSPARGFSGTESHAFDKMPEVMQLEVLKCLEALSIKFDKQAQESIDIKRIKAQYLKLAQTYHPDVIINRLEAKNASEKER